MVLLLTSLNPKHIFDEKILRIQDSLFACANKLVLQIARPFKILVCLLFCLVISLLMQFSRYNGELKH